jgi:hypothetical protein
MRKIGALIIVLSFMLAFSGMLLCEDKKSEGTSNYILLATKRTGTMQKEMDEAAQNGYKVRMGSSTAGTEMVILLEKVATPPDLYKFKLLATTRTGTMEKELNEGGDNGFRMLPNTMIAKQGMMTNEVVVILEKAPNSASRYQYKLLATSRTSTMEKEIKETQAAGFTLVGICSMGEHMVIMEKELK